MGQPVNLSKCRILDRSNQQAGKRTGHGENQTHPTSCIWRVEVAKVSNQSHTEDTEGWVL